MDEFDARLRSLRPDDVDRHAPLPSRVERHRQLVLRHARGANRSRRSLIWTTAAAVLVVIATVFSVIKVGAGPVYALTPPPLNFERDEGGVEDIVENALLRLGVAGPESPERRSSYVGWFAQIDMDKPRGPAIIAPQSVTLTWRDDLSAEQIVTAAEAYWADPEARGPVDSTSPTAGSVLSDTTFEAGEFAVPEIAAPGEGAQDMQRFLGLFGLVPHSGAGDIMEAIDSAMSLWTLTNQQHAHLLEMLLDAGDVELLGTATDRAGRSVVGLRAEPQSFQGSSRTLLISAETGRIVGIETTRTTAEPPLETGTVVAYKLWEVSP